MVIIVLLMYIIYVILISNEKTKLIYIYAYVCAIEIIIPINASSYTHFTYHPMGSGSVEFIRLRNPI